MYKTAYRLSKYRITEFENSIIWWEAHSSLAMQQRGKCFVLGDILIFGRSVHEENGYMILEFHEQLEKLPAWNKTSYYCYASNLLDVATGHNLSEDLLQRISITCSARSAALNPGIDLNTMTFRLEQYQITVAMNREVSWQTHEGVNKIIGGQCIIKSDVLFIAAQENEAREQNKKAFLQTLLRLPKWDMTIAWSKSMALQTCQPQVAVFNNAVEPKTKPAQERIAASPVKHPQKGATLPGLSTAIDLYKCSGSAKKLIKSVIDWLKISRQRLKTSNFGLKYLIPIVVAGLLFGLAILLYPNEKKMNKSHELKKHHHKHDD